MGLKPGPKPIAKSTGKPDQRRRDNKDTPGNTPGVKPSKSSGKSIGGYRLFIYAHPYNKRQLKFFHRSMITYFMEQNSGLVI